MKTYKLAIILILSLLTYFLYEINPCYAASPDTLKFIGHSFIKLKTSEGKVIYVDPFSVNDFSDSADVVLITHEHSDHTALSKVKRKTSCQVIRSANAILGGVYQNFTIGNIKVKAVLAYNSNHAINECVGYVIEFDSIKLYHAGDTGLIPEMADLASQNITYALLPMDGIYTMSPEEATQAAALINAKYDIPIHTMPPPDTYSDAIVARFTSLHKLVVRHNTSIELTPTATSVEKYITRPEGFRLEQNYPNPFNPITNIAFHIDNFGFVSLKIYDVLGKEVGTLISENLHAGNHSRLWNMIGMPSGIYFYKLQVGNYAEVKKLVLLK